MKRVLSAVGPLAGLLLVVCLFLVAAPPAFRTVYNAKTVVTQTVITGIGALGMTLVIVSGGIDLSVGSVIALATVVAARVLGLDPSGASLLWPLAAAGAAAVAGGVCGFLNGVISAGLGIVPFIATLGMMQVARGVAKWFGREQTVLAPETWLNGLMNVSPTPAWMVFAPGVWVMAALGALLSAVLRFTVFGRHVLAVGSNEAAARLCGVPVVRRRILVYMLCGLFTGIAGVMQFANLTVGDPTAAEGMELDIIAAVVIGGGSLRGGEGSAGGSLIGALMMAVLRNGCNLIGIPNYVQNIVIGAVIIGAVAVDRIKQKRYD